MAEEYKLVSYHLFEPAAKNVKQRCELTYCNASACPYRDEGKCVVGMGFFGGMSVHCPHCRFEVKEGFTRIAKGFRGWFEKKRNYYGRELEDRLKREDKRLARVGEGYVYLPYNHLKTYVNQVDGVLYEHFLKEEDFTAAKVEEIVDFQPATLLELAPIRSYQEKEVPRFLRQLSEVMPGLYKEFLERCPDIAKQVESVVNDYRGRRAKVATLADGSIICDVHGNTWVKQGDTLTCENCDTSIMIPFYSGEPTRMSVRITDGMECKVTDNSQIGDRTEFVD